MTGIERAAGSLLVAAVATSLMACPPPDNPFQPYPDPDLETFELDLQPLLATDCASSGCHGTHERSLTLFAVDGLRLAPDQPRQPVDPDVLSTAELAWNFDAMRIRLRGVGKPDSALLLLKCLDPAKGGIDHADGFVVYEDKQDPGYILLREWIGSAR